MQLHQLEAGAFEYDLCVKYAGLDEAQLGNKIAVNAALGRLLRKAVVALVTQEESKQKK